MALTVLIVEDEQSASRLLSGIAAEVVLSARATGSGKEAQQLCAQAADSGQPFSAVVLDLVLSELDGFQFGTAARAAAWGAKLPIIVVSGVYKKLPEEFAARIHPAAFFAKDFGEFILPYDAVREEPRPHEHLLTFLQSTYAAAADLAKWDRALLERTPA